MEALSVLQNLEKMLIKKKSTNATVQKKSETETEEDLDKYQQLVSIVKKIFYNILCFFPLFFYYREIKFFKF